MLLGWLGLAAVGCTFKPWLNIITVVVGLLAHTTLFLRTCLQSWEIRANQYEVTPLRAEFRDMLNTACPCDGAWEVSRQSCVGRNVHSWAAL